MLTHKLLNPSLDYWVGQRKLAISLAKAAHNGEFRRDNKTPYFSHIQAALDYYDRQGGNRPYEVKPYEREIVRCVIATHDILENHPSGSVFFSGALTPFVGDCAQALNFKTGRKGDTYGALIKSRILGVWVLEEAKFSDIVVNMADAPTAHQIRKYAMPLATLASSLVLRDDTETHV